MVNAPVIRRTNVLLLCCNECLERDRIGRRGAQGKIFSIREVCVVVDVGREVGVIAVSFSDAQKYCQPLKRGELDDR